MGDVTASFTSRGFEAEGNPFGRVGGIRKCLFAFVQKRIFLDVGGDAFNKCLAIIRHWDTWFGFSDSEIWPSMAAAAYYSLDGICTFPIQNKSQRELLDAPS